MAAAARRLEAYEIAGHEAQVGRTGRRDRLVVDGNPAAGAGPAAGDTLRRIAGAPGRSREHQRNAGRHVRGRLDGEGKLLAEATAPAAGAAGVGDQFAA